MASHIHGEFDPYYKWLGIPPGEQPANHYRLLGICEFEDDLDVIEHAADRQMTHVRSFAAGPRAHWSQTILNEISAARICLLDPAKKAVYDRQMRDRLAELVPKPPALPGGSPTTKPRSPDVTGAVGPVPVPPAMSASRLSPSASRRGRRESRAVSTWRFVQIAIGAVAGICVAIVLLWVFFGKDPFGVLTRPEAPIAAAWTEPTAAKEAFSSGRKVPSPRRKARVSGTSKTPLKQERTTPKPGGSTSPPRSKSPTPGQSTARIVPTNSAPGNHESPGPAHGHQDASEKPDFVTAKPSASSVPGNAPPTEPANRMAGVANPFAELPAEVALDFSGVPGLELRLPLGRLGSPPQLNWKIAVETAAADLSGYRLHVGQPSREVGEMVWPLRYEPRANPGNNPTETEPGRETGPFEIRLVVGENSLFFRIPRALGENKQVRQLCNCALVLSDGKNTHRMQLRQARQMAALTLDLSEQDGNVEIEFEVPATPVDESLVLQVAFSGNRPANLVVDPASGEVPYAKPLKLKLTQWEGAEIQLRLVKSDSKYRVLIRPVFYSNKSRRSLTAESVAKEGKRLTMQVLNAQKSLARAQHRLRAIPGERSRVQSVRPRSRAAQAKQGIALNVLARESKKLNIAIGRASTTIPQLQQAIQRMNELARVVDALKHQIKIPLRVFAKTETGRIDLLVMM